MQLSGTKGFIGEIKFAHVKEKLSHSLRVRGDGASNWEAADRVPDTERLSEEISNTVGRGRLEGEGHVKGKEWFALNNEDATNGDGKMDTHDDDDNKEDDEEEEDEDMGEEDKDDEEDEESDEEEYFAARMAQRVRDSHFPLTVSNLNQTLAKYNDRFRLGFTRTFAASTIPTTVQDIPDQVSVCPSGVRHILTDGCAGIALDLMMGLQSQLQLPFLPSAVQGRLGSAKGMWYLDTSLPAVRSGISGL